MPSWLTVADDWGASPLAVIGFGVTWWQIFKTKSAAQAAKTAAEGAVDQIGTNLLLVVLPQLVQIETHLEWAVSRKDRDAAIHYLGVWRWQAGQVRGHLLKREGVQPDFLSQLQTSIATAADTKLALQDLNADVARRSKSAQKSIAIVTGMVGELTVKNSLEGNISNAVI